MRRLPTDALRPGEGMPSHPMPQTEVGFDVWGWLREKTKYQPTTRVRKMRKNITPWWADVLIVVGLLAAVLVPYCTGWRLRVGPSMGKTLGLVYQVKGNVMPTAVNQFVVVEEPAETRLKHWWDFPRRWVAKNTAKRVVELRPNGIIVKGDNDERSTDSRDWQQAVIPWSKIRGVITRRWPAPKTFAEKITWMYPPRDQVWSPDGLLVAIRQGDNLTVVNPSLRVVFSLPKESEFREWDGAKLFFDRQTMGDGVFYKETYETGPPEWRVEKRAPRLRPRSVPGVRLLCHLEFYEVAAGEKRITTADTPVLVLVTAPAPILLNGKSVAPGTPFTVQGRLHFAIPDGPPFDVPGSPVAVDIYEPTLGGR